MVGNARHTPARAALVLACLLALLASATLPASAAPRTTTECTRALATNREFGLEMINQHRAEAGVPPLRAHVGLNAVAQDWSVTMATTGDYEHRPEHWKAYPSDMGGGGENIFYGMDSRAAAAFLHVGFVNSPGHFANMLHDRHTHVGLGYACVPFDEEWGTGVWIYTTQNYGTTPELSAIEQPPAPLRRPLTNACPASLVTPNPYVDIVPEGHGHSVLCLNAWGLTTDYRSYYGARNYDPQYEAARAAFAEMLHRLLLAAGAAPAGTTTGPFVDVPSHHPNARAINALASMGVISGVSATHFAPDRGVTRGQMASLMVRAHDESFSRSFPLGSRLTDIAGTTHETNIRRLVGGGITVGYPDGSYRPSESMTRGQMATFHARYADLLVREQLAQLPAR